MILRVVFAAGFMYVAYLVHSLQQEFRKLSIQYGTVMNSTTYPGKFFIVVVLSCCVDLLLDAANL